MTIINKNKTYGEKGLKELNKSDALKDYGQHYLRKISRQVCSNWWRLVNKLCVKKTQQMCENKQQNLNSESILTHKWEKIHTKTSTEQKTRSEEDGSSASAPLIAHDSLRLANYAL